MKQLFSIILLLSTLSMSTAQKSLCLNDFPDSTQQLMRKIVFDSTNKTEMQSKQIQSDLSHISWKSEFPEVINQLNKVITDQEIDLMFNCFMNTTKALSFFLFVKRSSKEEAIKKFLSLLNSKYGSVTRTMTDVVITTSLQSVCFDFLRYQFRNEITRQELRELSINLENFEKPGY